MLPAPTSRRADDFVFVSSLYPVDADGALVTTGPQQWFGRSEMEVQTAAVLDMLDSILKEAGSSVDLVLKVEVQLVDASDFVDFKRVYAERFAKDPPARTTIVVGDEHPLAGARLNLHAVALASDSGYRRETITADPSPLDAEHATAAVKAGPFVFCSAFTATDFSQGLAAARPTGAYHGTDALAQANYVISRLEAVLGSAGSALDQGLKVQFYQADLENFAVVDREWGERVGIPPTRSSMACQGFLVPGALFAANLMALIPGEGLEKNETREGIPWHPVDSGKANFSPGIRAGSWLFTSGQVPVPDISTLDVVRTPPGLPHYWSDIEIQTNATMDLVRTQVEANGLTLADITDARVYLVEPRRDFRGFAQAWSRIFPDEAARPTMSIIPARQANGQAGIMIHDTLVEIDLICWAAQS